MVEEAAPGIFRIELPLPQNPLKALNSYLVRGEKRHLLVDTGFNRKECKDVLYGALEELGVRPDALDLFITHLHADHCGLAADLTTSPEAVIYASQGDSKAINRMTDGDFWLGYLRGMAQHGCDDELLHELESSHPAIRFGPSGKIGFSITGEGAVLRYGENELHVLSVPGHTPDHLALYEPRRKILFSGDLILGDITPNIPRWREMKDALGTYLQSLDKADRLDIALTLPGHRSLVRDTKKRIEELRAHHARRLAEVRRILEERALTACQVAAEMTWSMRGIRWKEFPAPQKWFAVNEALAHLDYLAARSEALREEDGGLVRFRRQKSA
ncbi:MAG: MBL fold metallo-hydrolase [Deltaproteobacteria bacterium]|jgi:glyoxylase-like metal-dependent hydrolase (beta-lactamase superfamily II)|nr:MBL fold metallo-hydrolase [Deltaproteobacteria bacterium]